MFAVCCVVVVISSMKYFSWMSRFSIETHLFFSDAIFFIISLSLRFAMNLTFEVGCRRKTPEANIYECFVNE